MQKKTCIFTSPLSSWGPRCPPSLPERKSATGSDLFYIGPFPCFCAEDKIVIYKRLSTELFYFNFSPVLQRSDEQVKWPPFVKQFKAIKRPPV